MQKKKENVHNIWSRRLCLKYSWYTKAVCIDLRVLVKCKMFLTFRVFLCLAIVPELFLANNVKMLLILFVYKVSKKH